MSTSASGIPAKSFEGVQPPNFEFKTEGNKGSETPEISNLEQLDGLYRDPGTSTLESAVSNYLTLNRISCLREQVNLQPDTHLTSNEYQTYLQIFSWTVMKHLETSSTPLPKSQLTEEEVSPLVDKIFKPTCVIMPDSSDFSDITPIFLRSRVIWYTTRSIG